jgi:predicted secreted protein
VTRRFAIMVLAGFLVGGTQAAEPDPSDPEKVQASLKKWQQLKKDCGGNYSYKVNWSSFTGFGHKTEVIVRNNKVVERRYRAFRGRPVPIRLGQPKPRPEGESWVEQGKDLGTHKKGAPPKTLDELYAQADEVAQRKLAQHERRYVRFDKQGLLGSCFIVDTRIADDAPRNGVAISSISLGGDGASSPIQLTARDNGKTISVREGQTITIRLAGNPTTGFTWNDATKSDVVKLSGKVEHRAGGTALGAPGVSTATFVAVKAGKSTIALEYKRVFEKKPAAKTFTVNVVVQGRTTPPEKP